MSDQWEFFFCAIENAPASVFVDIGIFDSAPDPERPHLATIRIYLQNPTEQGLTTDAEADRLWEIEEKLTRALSRAVDAFFVGRITSAGARDFYYYCNRVDEVENVVASVLDSASNYDYSVETEFDPEWNDYLETLYPAPADWQQILDRQLVEELIEMGDPLTTPREVAHFLYFNTAEGRDQFAEEAKVLGFNVRDTVEQPEEDHPYGVCVTRIDPVVMDHIHGVTRELLARAAPHGGIYDGWECEFMGPNVL